MRCKQGDVAMFRGDEGCPNNGKYVTCLVYLGQRMTTTNPDKPPALLDVWKVTSGLKNCDGGPADLAADKNLYPIPPDIVTKEEVKELFATPPRKKAVHK